MSGLRYAICHTCGAYQFFRMILSGGMYVWSCQNAECKAECTTDSLKAAA